jgi:prepilin-type N-terminal cleavage/methylation domain-containing protein
VDQPQEWKKIMDQGFTLTEVLVSLLLMTSTSLALLKQQWQVSQLFNQIHTRASALAALDNAAERLHIGFEHLTVDGPFKLRYSRAAVTPLILNSGHKNDDHAQQRIDMRIMWTSLSSSLSSSVMARQLVVDLNDD